MSSNQGPTARHPTQTTLYPDANFDLIARFYPILEQCVFRSELNHARLAFHEVVLQADRLLLVGEGNGRFLQWLIAHKINGSITVVEKSGVMIRLARYRAAGLRKTSLEFHHTDFRRYAADQPFDCIVTHFFHDQFDPPAQRVVVEKLGELGTDNGTWINVDFTLPRSWQERLLMQLQYLFFRLVSRIEARHGHDEKAVATENRWLLSQSLPFLNGLVLARRYQKQGAARGQ